LKNGVSQLALAGSEQWATHLKHLDDVLSMLERAESHAKELRALAKSFATSARKKA
jgi:hypothetical protein